MRALIVTNMWPTPAAPARGSFVRDQVNALRELDGVEVDVFAFPPGGYLRAARDVRRRHGATTYDVVHAHFGLTAWPALALRGAPHVVTLHGTDLRHPRSRRITRAALPFCDLVAAVSDELAAEARDRRGRRDVTLVITGGLRDAADFAKALALGADAVAIANSAIQAIGCLGMRACHSNNCPVGIATQKPHLRARLPVEEAAQRLNRFLRATVELMQVLARACGHSHLSEFRLADLTTFHREMADLSGVAYGGVG